MASKGRVHTRRLNAAGEPTFGDAGEMQALCRQKHRPMLPLALDDSWRAVTCEKCLRKRPSLSLRERCRQWVDWFPGARR